ncbi:MAG: hypothetical protein B7X65_17585 [Polaromonas sp. 39-63-25]|jgi:hypothetical protein|nr:MAG: hypothetical protein B7Y60_19380 [Polaromonas sp. 35-63-35]OYZ18325.1 MAG: hypothetical protein B7Y28_16615 [Polaromonas sp. 16-63-31]OYZ77015.1 MAG: hypothetical protein B7Y09_18045 [Polaromonas sp. 24-63-21]OZA48044.1 MAG: hypothetical protein B7X88_19660 [Polaromonas sp. 17-63-33]OZA86306.1 MAG: hypothetical protein B7X65_17585 [Polaromonas sp. 39-63-25]
MRTFAYLRVDTPGIKDERFVRTSKLVDDPQFNQLRKDEHRTFPFLVFDLRTKTESENYVQVLCSRLRAVSTSKTDELVHAWK